MSRLLIAITLSFVAGSAFGDANGVDSRSHFPPLGCGSTEGGGESDCHVQNADPALTVTLVGPAEIGIGPEEVGFYTVSIPVGFGGLEGAGVNIAMAPPNSAGCELETFAPIDDMGYLNETFEPDPVISHIYEGEAPPNTLVGVWSYQFLVGNCQTPGPLLLLAAMNAFDGSGDETGEVWNKTQLEITVPEPGALWLGAGAVAALASLRGVQRRA